VTGLPAPGPEADRDLPLDAHLHTNLSPDSDVPIDVYCASAVERGIPEIAITDHVDFDPRAPAHSFASFATREREVREAAARWADRGLRVHFGVEISFESHREAEIREHLARNPYDFVIGSVHVMPLSPYTGARVAGWVAGRTPCLAAIHVLEDEPELIERLWSNTRRFKAELARMGFDTGASETPITPVMVGDSAAAIRFADRLLDEGVWATSVVFPTVALDGARLRTIVTAAHSDEELDTCLDAFSRVGRELGLIAG